MRTSTRIMSVLATATLSIGAGVGSAQAAPGFGFVPAETSASLSTLQAGAHPDVNVKFGMARDGADKPLGGTREVITDLPAGLVGNPTNYATCSLSNVVQMVYAQDRPTNAKACPREAAVGYADITIRYSYFAFKVPYRQRVYRLPTNEDEPAAFGTSVLGLPVKMAASVRSDGDYGLTVSGIKLPEPELLYSFDATFWGVPADHQGTSTTMWDGNPNSFSSQQTDDARFGGPLAGAPRTPFLSNPGRCAGSSLSIGLSARSWADPGTLMGPLDLGLGEISGCDQLRFTPSIDVTPETKQAGQPSGYRVDVSVPQTNSADALSTPNLKDAVVTMPKGLALSPTVADGLQACTDGELAITSKARESCPLASKIGSVDIDTPLLDDPLTGSLYVGEQLSNDPESGKMYRLFLTAYGSGVRIKLRGAVKADKNTGQLTATFLDNPQLPFSKLSLHFKSGDRAPLANATVCGPQKTTGVFSSWGGQSQDVSNAFTIDQACPTGQFAPSFNAGMTGPWAGAFSSFSLDVARDDRQQELKSIRSVKMPDGLLGRVSGVSLCGAVDAERGTCPADSRIGHVQVAAGAGGSPLWVPQAGRRPTAVYLTGPYRGAPFGLSVVVPAEAGPYDLGTVVDRLSLHVDAQTAGLTVREEQSRVFDPGGSLERVIEGGMPSVVKGVPLRVKELRVIVDRPDFMFNPTSCKPMSIDSELVSTEGASAKASVPYQARRCNGLRLQPSLKIGLSGSKEFKKGGHPKLTADLSQTRGQTNLKNVKVVLPPMLALAADNAQALCKPEEAAARKCPEGSIVGRATAKTPALHEPLSGPVYFVENTRTSEAGRVVKTLPKLWLKLAGEGVTLDLWAKSEIDSSKSPQRLVSTFENVPDAPVSGFHLEIDGGKHGILAATDSVCALKRNDRKSQVTFTGQNEGVLERRVTIKPTDCGLDVVSKALDSSRIRVRVSGIGAGKLTISGKGIKKHHRTIKRATAATIAGKLTVSGKRLAKQGKVLRPRVSFNPKVKGKKTVSVKTTVKRSKKSR